MVFPPDTVGVYLDWRTQEVGIAAALSQDRQLTEAYRAGDVYYALALACGFTDDPDPQNWKKNTAGNLYDTFCLGSALITTLILTDNYWSSEAVAKGWQNPRMKAIITRLFPERIYPDLTIIVEFNNHPDTQRE